MNPNIEQEKRTFLLRELERVLGPILSPRQSFRPVEDSIELLDPADYEFVEHWLKVTAASNVELAYVFACSIGTARSKIGQKAVRVWLNQGLATYDREGLYPAIKAIQDIDGFKQKYAREVYTCRLEEVKPGLDIFIRGLSGRELGIKKSEEVYTDTLYLYLPESISKYRDKERNRALYKAMACFLWAQNWYGTFRRHSYNSLSTDARLRHYEPLDRARNIFLALENIRLLACIERELPGLHREMTRLSPMITPPDRTWKTIARRLQGKDATVEDSFDCLDLVLKLDIDPEVTHYQGQLELELVEGAIEGRRMNLLEALKELLESDKLDIAQIEEAFDRYNTTEEDRIQGVGDESEAGGGESDLGQGGVEELRSLLNSLLQDVQNLDNSMLEQLEGTESPHLEEQGQKGLDLSTSNGAHLVEFDEWDYLRQGYRKNWCRVHIREVEPGDREFYRETEQKYPFLIGQIRKVFEAMRDQPRYENRQTDGDEIDLDAVVETFTAKVTGEELSERMYIRRQQSERSVAVFLLVDMSGSTKGWINLAMRESLVLFSRALETLGDQYSILGFSGLTRQRCEIYSVKRFGESCPDEINARIANIQAKDYTRMGFAIRYARRVLLRTDSKHRILLLLSDGKPDDYDGYQGEYGIQDTRKAILEAQGSGIKPYSITIDKQAQAYLPRLFGPGQYLILDKVPALPLKLSEVYRKLSA